MSNLSSGKLAQQHARYQGKVTEKTYLIFAAVLAFWSTIPARAVPWIEFGELRVNFNDVLLCIATLLALIFTNWRLRKPSIHIKRIRGFPISFYLLITYALISTFWSETNAIDTAGMIWTLAMAVSTATLAYCVTRSSSLAVLQQRLWQLTIALALISLIYFAESFFSLGLRSAENTSWTDFGIQRLRGPLYNSTVGQFILFPALGYSVDRLTSQRGRKLITGLIVLLLCACIFALGSRSVVLGLAAFVVVAITKLRAKAKIVFIAVAPVVIIIAGSFVFSRADSERMIDMTDITRAATYNTAVTMIKTAELTTQIFGAGYGGRWSWYRTDTTPGALETELQFHDTPYGFTLYHPHSTPLLIAVELGVIGLFIGSALLLWLFRVVSFNLRNNAFPFLNIGLVASMLIFCLDLLIFKSPQVNAVWWVYTCGAAAMTRIPCSND